MTQKDNLFKKAERRQVPLKIGISGPAGSGKTMSALLIAQGIAEIEKSRIALIDTENNSASLYDSLNFDTCPIEPPYTIDKYIGAIDEAIKSDYKILIIDTISHAWAGEGGLLQKKELLDSRGGNQFANWKPITQEQEKFIAKILHSEIHIIATMRSKQEYILTDDNGKQKPQKIGLAPVQRDGVEYEFTTVFNIAMNHTVQATKDRTGLFDDRIFKPTVETGRELMAWLYKGKEIPKGDVDVFIKKFDEAKTMPEVTAIAQEINNFKFTKDELTMLRTKFQSCGNNLKDKTQVVGL